MAKIKKISASAFERAVKKNFENVITDEWNGLSITITPTISLQEVFNLVAEVSSNCFSDDGQYIPEAMSALLNCGIVEKYTNIELPDDIAAKYELVMKSGLTEFILPQINEMQYNQIIDSIRDKVDYVCDSNISKLSNSVSQIVESVKDLKERAERLFDGIPDGEIRSFINSFAGGQNIEQMAIEEYKKANS